MAQSRSQSRSGGPFHCGYFGCNKTFTRRTGARRHETTVHGDKKYCCHEPDCNYRGGKRRNDFVKHMKDKHPGHDVLAYETCKDHLFVPDNFSNPQGSQSPVANCSQSPEIKYASQVSGDFSQMPLLPSTSSDPRFNPIDTQKRPTASMMISPASVSVSQPHGNMISQNTIPLRPPDLRASQVVNLPRPEFEPALTATTSFGNTWGQVQPSIMCSTGSTLQDMAGTSLENEYEAFDGEYDLSRYGQPGNNSYYKW
ncbi:hypothetical protein NHQ30_010208 [Ciborinia camelliae]|nr:hypothetical protein NHQ30_010208 [Ciborinia camelliae]